MRVRGDGVRDDEVRVREDGVTVRGMERVRDEVRVRGDGARVRRDGVSEDGVREGVTFRPSIHHWDNGCLVDLSIVMVTEETHQHPI